MFSLDCRVSYGRRLGHNKSSRCPGHGGLLNHVRREVKQTKLKQIFLEIEEEYLEEDYNYIDGYDDEYYADGEEYFDEYSGGPNRGDQSLVSPESKPRLS